jgi:hypothetical protein
MRNIRTKYESIFRKLKNVFHKLSEIGYKITSSHMIFNLKADGILFQNKLPNPQESNLMLLLLNNNN